LKWVALQPGFRRGWGEWLAKGLFNTLVYVKAEDDLPAATRCFMSCERWPKAIPMTP
jgi:hypothetical protein